MLRAFAKPIDTGAAGYKIKMVNKFMKTFHSHCCTSDNRRAKYKYSRDTQSLHPQIKQSSVNTQNRPEIQMK